ncbi:MAG TPA: hypothetical protein VMH23_11610 [Bacteroidota bacterium]|nr:hypothetical protein [Bacteroidota bacterium]
MKAGSESDFQTITMRRNEVRSIEGASSSQFEEGKGFEEQPSGAEESYGEPTIAKRS